MYMLYRIILISILIVLSGCKHRGSQYNGYIDADLTYLSSDFAGRLSHLLVHRGETVRTHQPLFVLEQTSEHYSVEISELNHQNLLAQRQQLVDQMTYDEINYHRTATMRKDNAARQNDLDVATKDLNVLKNQLAAIDAQIKSSIIDTKNQEWHLKRKANQATDQGFIFDTYYTQGEYVQAGQPIVSLITNKNIKVIFYAPEKDLQQLQLNKKLVLSNIGQNTALTATISYISNKAQYTPPIIYSRENRQELIFRIEARLDNPDLSRIHLGQPVSLEIIS